MGRDPKAEVEISAHSRSLGAKLREARAKFTSFGLELRKNVFGKDLVERGFRSMAAAHTVGQLGANAVGGATEFMKDQALAAYHFDDALVRLQISSGAAAEEIKDMSSVITQTSKATGVSRESLLAGVQAMVEFTGNAANARAQTKLLAEAMQATGADSKDLAGIFATLEKNVHLDPSQYREALDILVHQAHAGSVELRDLAGAATRALAVYSTMFEGGSSTKSLAEVSAMAQVLNNMTHDANLTSTYLVDSFNDLRKDAKHLRAIGIEPFRIDPVTKKKLLKDGFELLGELKAKLGNNTELFRKMFPDMRGEGALEYLVQNLDEVKRLAADSANSNQVAKDFAVQQASSAAKIEKSWNSVKLSIAEAFTPGRIQAFADGLAAGAEAVRNTVELIKRFSSGRWKSDEVYQSEASNELFYKHINRGDATQAELVQRAKTIYEAGSSEGLARQLAGMSVKDTAWFALDRPSKASYDDLRIAAKSYLNDTVGLAEGWDYGLKNQSSSPIDVVNRTMTAAGYQSGQGNLAADIGREVAKQLGPVLRGIGLGSGPAEVKIDGARAGKVLRESTTRGRSRPGG